SLDQLSGRSEHTLALAAHAVACLRTNEPDAACESALRAAALVRTTAPVAYWMLVGLTHTLEVLLALLEENRTPPRRRLLEEAQAVLRATRSYTRMFPIGRPEVLLSSGRVAWHLGRHRAAMARWSHALAIAGRLRMPYELGRAHLEIGRHLAPERAERWQHLADAAAIFERIGCAWELARVRALAANTHTASLWQESSVA